MLIWLAIILATLNERHRRKHYCKILKILFRLIFTVSSFCERSTAIPPCLTRPVYMPWSVPLTRSKSSRMDGHRRAGWRRIDAAHRNPSLRCDWLQYDFESSIPSLLVNFIVLNLRDRWASFQLGAIVINCCNHWIFATSQYHAPLSAPITGHLFESRQLDETLYYFIRCDD